MQTELQVVWTQIRLLLKKSDLGLHCISPWGAIRSGSTQFAKTKCLGSLQQSKKDGLISSPWEYKNPTWVWGADRKFHHEGRCLASQGFAEWCKTVIPRDRIFYPHQTLMFDSFSCIPFDFKWFIFKVTFITTNNDVGVGHFLKWCHCDVAMTTKLRDVLYRTNANRIHLSITRYIISISSNKRC